MNNFLKQIQTELHWLKKAHKTKTKHAKNKFADTLDLMQTLEKNELQLNFRFYYYHEQSGLGCRYEIITQTKKKQPIIESYSFFDAKKKQLPGISLDDCKKLENAYEYRLDKNIVKSVILPANQAKIFTETVKANYDTIVKYALSKTKGK